MIEPDTVREIITTYTKHGWILRRVLLSPASRQGLAAKTHDLFGDSSVLDSDIDAAWFSRPPKTGGVAWELRYLGELAFALLEKADENSTEFENVLTGVEGRLCESLAAKR